jgi:hypothetical protein
MDSPSHNFDAVVQAVIKSAEHYTLSERESYGGNRTIRCGVLHAAERVTEGNKVEYEVSARQGKKKISLVFDSDGKLLKSTVP